MGRALVQLAWRGLLAVGATTLLTACASRPINEPLGQVDRSQGYRPAALMPARQNNDKGTLFILSFSGGGTRAAALSYGVLEELRETVYPADDGHQRRLLDEVDLITGVSGGSFTALAYALHGDRLFDEYEQRFLKRNVQGALAARSVLNPINWFRLMSPHFGRSEIAEDYYDVILFEGATFDDLLDRAASLPVAIASGTDITTGARFAFWQEDFDLICSDLGAVRLARAAAASSAVPMVLSPVTLDNRGGNCGYRYPSWVADILEIEPHLRPAGRSFQRYEAMAEFRDSDNHPFIHLMDGGISDNIGVRGVIDAFEQFMFSGNFREQQGFAIIDTIVLLVVNAHSAHEKNWEKKASPPGAIKQMVQSAGVPIARYSFETVELMKDRAEVAEWRRRMQVAEAQLAGASREEAEAQFPRVNMHVIEISFDKVRDPVDREFFMDLPTNFALEDQEVDRLRAVAAELLRQSPIYRQLLSELQAQRVK